MKSKAQERSPSLVPALLTVGVGLGLMLLSNGRRRVTPDERSLALEAYDEVWSQVANRFYEVERLAGWGSWRHRFDHLIESVGDAVYYSNRMLRSLDDRYTHLMNPQETRVDEAHLNDRVTFPEVICPGVGYIDFTSFQAGSTGDQLKDALLRLADCDSIILDMRGNGGGWIDEALACCSLFLEEGRVMECRERLGDGSFQIKTVTLTPTAIETHYSPSGRVERKPRYRPVAAGKRIVALIDGGTASASELMLGCLKCHGLVVLIGQETRAKGIGQSTINVRPGLRLTVTSLRYLLPDGHWLGDAGMTVRRGLWPDVPLRHTDNRTCMAAAMAVIFQPRPVVA